MRTFIFRSPVRRPRPSALLAVSFCVVASVFAACGGSTPSVRPSSSLSIVDFSPLPTTNFPSVAPSRTPAKSSIPASWPIGWDVAFCNAFADTTVAHELIIDIERAIDDDNKTDAAGLATELAQTGPIATTEVTRMTDWEPAAELKTGLTNLLDLDTQAAISYESYFNDDVRSALRAARQLRNQVSKQVAPINEQLQHLTDLGLSCPGAELRLEDF